MELSFHMTMPVNKVEVALIFMTKFWWTWDNSSAVLFWSKLSHACQDPRGGDTNHHFLMGGVSKNFGDMFLKHHAFVVHLTYCTLSS